jgi:antibiotic biosynthesis monooxygenase (ABM) superfamily enzyme
MKQSNSKSDSETSEKVVSNTKPQRPIYWKQVLITTFTVYPLLMIIQWLLNLLAPMQSIPKELGVLIAVFGVASLMVFPVMPLTMKLLGSWLFKK